VYCGGEHRTWLTLEKGAAMHHPEEMSDRQPDVDYVRRELARNLRERVLLRKLLKIAEERAKIRKLTKPDESEGAA
jgi:hypothetical protein